ncbi:cache domain-containing protein [Sporomusa aerivorans]|uniref:sensor histidine kinase n=1 Tax=Sporomusa aerivorans TaxID=204936 RepID=UPI00352A1D04
MKATTLERQLKLWMMLLVIIPSLLIMMIYTVGQICTAKHKNLELINQRVGFTKQLIEFWVEERAKSVRILSGSAAFRTLAENRMQDNLELMQRLNTDFDSLSYIDKDGFFRMSTLNDGIRFNSTIKQPYYQAAIAGKEYISDVVIGRNSGLPIINFSAPVYDYSGKFQGLILGSVRTKTLETFIRNNWLGQTSEILLVNSQGVMIAEPKHSNNSPEEGLLEGSPLMKLALSEESLMKIHLGNSGTAAWVNYRNAKVLGAYQYIPERDWTLIGSIDEADILAPIYTQLGMMAIGTGLLLLMILPLATYITKRVKRPIDWLIEQSNLIVLQEYNCLAGQNGFSEKLPYELDRLCATFTNMSHKIKTTVQLLKEKEIKLESQVLEIETINARLTNEIVQRKLVEEIRREEAKEMARIEKAASLGILAAGMAHEINQPLNAIKVASGAALYWHRQGKPLEMARIMADIKSIATQADRIDQIIRNIRSFAKPDKQLQVPVNLNETIQKVVQLLGSQTSFHNIELKVTLCKSPSEILIVPAALEGIIINLLTNAIQALDTVEYIQKRIEINTQATDGRIILEVIDNGPGIETALLCRIFEPFFSTKPEEKGMGLGLSIVHSFVESNQGTIEVKQAPYGGTVFRVQFPLYQEAGENSNAQIASLC